MPIQILFTRKMLCCSIPSNFNKSRVLRRFSQGARSYSNSTDMKFDGICMVQKSDAVFNIQLNRPDSLNSFTRELWNELRRAVDHLAELPKCRAIVLSGNGNAFSVGIDRKWFQYILEEVINNPRMDGARKGREIHRILKIHQDGFTALEKSPKPVIAAIHGHCIGAGINMVSCVDCRFASKDTVFSIKEVDLGIAAPDGILARIQKLVRNDSWAREVAFTGRNFTAAEALENGFVSRVFETKEECLAGALRMAEEIALKSPIAVQGTKLAMNHARDHSVEDALEWVKTWSSSQLQNEDITKIATSMRTKEKPKFNDV